MKCVLCGVDKPMTTEHFRSYKPGGLFRPRCIPCLSMKGKKYWADNKHRLKEKRRQYYQDHKEVILKKDKEYKLKHQEKRYLSNRRGELRRYYGISLEQYKEMWASQEGKCLICLRHEDTLPKRLCVDHNHNTGKVRGLLCIRCNLAIGLLAESTDVFQRCVGYLLPERGQ